MSYEAATAFPQGAWRHIAGHFFGENMRFASLVALMIFDNTMSMFGRENSPSARPFLPILAGLLLASAGAICANAADYGRPNIIVILADDLGYGDLSCFGQENFRTPRLDQMASEGMRLTSHYAGSTVCAPSRACLLTGQHTGHVYQRFNGNLEFRADPLDLTIARMLKSVGYHTAMIGKSGLSCNSDNGLLPNEKGFDHFFGYTSHGMAHRYYPQWLWRNGDKVFFPGNHGREGDAYSTDQFLDETMSLLDRHADGPFFLHLSLQQPHADLSVPEQWKKPFLGQYEEDPYEGSHYRQEAHPKSTFAGMVSHLDDCVGQVLDKLRELGIDENTLVIFSSDNGAMSEGGWSREYFNSSGPLRGGKRDLYEGGIRVPTIAWWPGRIDPGSSSDHVSAFWDYVPTACELVGIQPPAETDGISFLPTLLGKKKQRQHKYLYWEFYEQGGKQAVRMGKWKAVRLFVGENPHSPIELYDLSSDLAETNDVAGSHPRVVSRMKEIMLEAHRPSELISFSGEKRVRAAKSDLGRKK